MGRYGWNWRKHGAKRMSTRSNSRPASGGQEPAPGPQPRACTKPGTGHCDQEPTRQITLRGPNAYRKRLEGRGAQPPRRTALRARAGASPTIRGGCAFETGWLRSASPSGRATLRRNESGARTAGRLLRSLAGRPRRKLRARQLRRSGQMGSDDVLPGTACTAGKSTNSGRSFERAFPTCTHRCYDGRPPGTCAARCARRSLERSLARSRAPAHPRQANPKTR
jgi:hypothetical protein